MSRDQAGSCILGEIFYPIHLVSWDAGEKILSVQSVKYYSSTLTNFGTNFINE